MKSIKCKGSNTIIGVLCHQCLDIWLNSVVYEELLHEGHPESQNEL